MCSASHVPRKLCRPLHRTHDRASERAAEATTDPGTARPKTVAGSVFFSSVARWSAPTPERLNERLSKTAKERARSQDCSLSHSLLRSFLRCVADSAARSPVRSLACSLSPSLLRSSLPWFAQTLGDSLRRWSAGLRCTCSVAEAPAGAGRTCHFTRVLAH